MVDPLSTYDIDPNMESIEERKFCEPLSRGILIGILLAIPFWTGGAVLLFWWLK